MIKSMIFLSYQRKKKYYNALCVKTQAGESWLGGSVGWNIIPYAKKLRVRFLIRAHLGCEFDPWLGHVQEATYQYLSLTLMFLAPHPHLKSMNILGWGLKNAYELVKIKSTQMYWDFCLRHHESFFYIVHKLYELEHLLSHGCCVGCMYIFV